RTKVSRKAVGRLVARRCAQSPADPCMASMAKATTGSKTRIATSAESLSQLRPALAGCKTRFRVAAKASIGLSIEHFLFTSESLEPLYLFVCPHFRTQNCSHFRLGML